MSNPNANVRKFDGAVNAAAYWIYDHLLRAGDIVNDSTVTGTTVKAALNTLSASSSAVFPFVGAGLAEQDLVSYDATAGTWKNRTVAKALQGTGFQSIAIGIYSIASGNNNAIGIGSASTASGPSSISLGENSISSAGSTISIGNAASANTNINAIAIGSSASSSGSGSVALGRLSTSSGNLSVALGGSATSSAGNSIAIGASAAATTTDSIIVGALGSISGLRCTAVGRSATSTNDDNTLFGYLIGNSSIGSRNTSVGSQAFNSAAAAVSDVAVLGYNALTGALTTGANGSVAVGSSALAALTSGVNTAVGYQAGLLLTTGTGNCINGYQAGNILTTGSSMTIFGHDADGDAAARSGCVVLGRGATAAADDTLVVRMGNTSTKEIVVTPVVTSTPVSTVSNLPLTVGGTSYTIPLGPASYNYTSVLTSDEVIAVNNTVVDSTMTVSIPAGTYSFSYVGCITHSTATGGSITLRSSTAATMTWTGRADINASSAIAVDNNTAAVTAGNTGGIIATQSSTSKQVVHARGIITCAAASTITVAVYDSANQNITLHTGSSIAVTRT